MDNADLCRMTVENQLWSHTTSPLSGLQQLHLYLNFFKGGIKTIYKMSLRLRYTVCQTPFSGSEEYVSASFSQPKFVVQRPHFFSPSQMRFNNRKSEWYNGRLHKIWERVPNNFLWHAASIIKASSGSTLWGLAGGEHEWEIVTTFMSQWHLLNHCGNWMLR